MGDDVPIRSWASGFAAWCRRLAGDRGAIAWAIVVAIVYVGATVLLARIGPARVNPAMQAAVALAHGRLNLDLPAGTNDTATVGGLTYQVISPLPIAPYLAFVPFPALWAASRWISGCAFGVLAGWLCLPFARRYAGPGPRAYWLAVLGAFGTLLFDLAVQGDFYYLAQVQAMLFTLVALVEWRGRRRGVVLGAAFGLAALARPTVLLAAIPFGIALIVACRGRRFRTAFRYLLPIGLAVGLSAIYDAARFGSPLETGYGISALANPVLANARAAGLFSIRHVADNLALLIGQGFGFRDRFPFLVPDPYGQSILLTSPALLIAVGAGIRRQGAAILWAAAGLVTVPLLLYYGGGGWQTYGFRYFLDAVPFLLALVGLAMRRHFGRLEQALVGLSVAFVAYGLVWALFQ
jgi:hypothetical protein